jgi:membrane-bound lytic murein transglycosylase D
MERNSKRIVLNKLSLKFQIPLWILLGFVLLLVIISFEFARINRNSADEFTKEFNGRYAIYALQLPEKLSFAGEPVPLIDRDIVERFDRELLINTYWQSQTLVFIKKANRFFPLIDPILAKYKVPPNFRYLPLAESGLLNTVSPKNAVGIWQFTAETAKQYGLEVNKDVDERYNLEKSTDAACRYLLESYHLYRSWTLAAASYNMGRSSLNKQLKRQKANNYYDLILNEETARYLLRIIAIKTILEDPGKYGFHYRPEDLYPSVGIKEIEVDSTISDLADFAFNQGINYKILKIFNPWLRDISLPDASHKIYTIKIPLEGYHDYRRALELPADSLTEDKTNDIQP